MIDLKWQGLVEMIQGLLNLKKRIFPESASEIHQSAEQIRKEMAIPGAPSKSPVQWDTDKQRIAYFATNGFGGGIPTKRSNEYVESWYAVKRENGADVGNPLSHAKFIGGSAGGKRSQSRIHKGRWPIFRETADRIIDSLPEKLRSRIVKIAHEEGFMAR